MPFPSTANNSFTPYTTPWSKSQLGGGLPVYITNIRRLPDGRVTFHIGYEYPVTGLIGDYVPRLAPVREPQSPLLFSSVPGFCFQNSVIDGASGGGVSSR